MDKTTFRQHLDEAITMLVNFTKTLCYNDIANNFKYRITPNSRVVDQYDEHLTDQEISVLKSWNKYENHTLTAEQVTDLLCHDYKVPVWIDTSVYEAKPNFTIIDLFCSRRLRDDKELYYQGQIMPFHLQVTLPPDHLKIEKDGKFDINWKKRRDDSSKPKTLFTRLKKILVSSA